MSYFIFIKNLDNIENSIFKIAENQFDLNCLNIIQSDYKIIEDSQLNFDFVKYGQKIITSYSGNIINYTNADSISFNKVLLKSTISSYKQLISQFLESSKDNPSYTRWANYFDQLSSLDLDNIIYPLNISLEQHFKDLNQPSYNILQLP
jgi:hypothetical protein